MKIAKRHTCTGHRAAVYALAAGKDTRRLLSAGGDGWIVDWDLDNPENGHLLASVETQVFSLIFLPENNMLVAGNMNGGLHWIDLATPDRTRNVQHHRKGVYDLKSWNGWLFSAGGDGLLTRWAADTGRTVESYQLANQALRSIALAPGRAEIAIGSSDHSIYLLDLETFALRQTLKAAHTNSVFTVAYSPDERLLLSGGRDAMLRVWDLEKDCALVSEQAAHWYTINHLAFSPDGRYFATASRDKTVKIWDAGDFQLLKVLDVQRSGGHINSVNRLLWLPEGLISGSDDRTVIIWG